MKKIILLAGIIMCCMSSYASLTLTSYYSSITAPAPGGGNNYVPVQIYVSGETQLTYLTSVSYSSHGNTATPNTAQFDSNPLTNIRYYTPANGQPTTFTLNITAATTITQSYSVTFYIGVGSSDNSVNVLTYTITINPQTPVFWNVQECGNFTKNNCAAGYTGSTVNYCVPAHTYSASSQAAANQLAINAVNSGGQGNANNNGTCTVTPIQITSIYLDGNLITTGANLVKGTQHTLVVNWSGSVTSGSIHNQSQGISFSPPVNSISGGTSQTANFWYSDLDSPPAPVLITLTNSAGTTTKTLNFYPQ